MVGDHTLYSNLVLLMICGFTIIHHDNYRTVIILCVIFAIADSYIKYFVLHITKHEPCTIKLIVCKCDIM